MILLRGFLSSGTEGSGFELWLADSESLPAPAPKVALLILTGGAGGLSSGSPLSHILARCYGSRRAWGCAAVKDGQGGRQRGARSGARVNTSWSCDHPLQRGRRQGRNASGTCEEMMISLNHNDVGKLGQFQVLLNTSALMDAAYAQQVVLKKLLLKAGQYNSCGEKAKSTKIKITVLKLTIFKNSRFPLKGVVITITLIITTTSTSQRVYVNSVT